ncbi:sulfotransferase [Novosphingobium fuchskuhlense]|nr:sulfotransferase [Novosphingobium fuchskuhlense]
MTAALRPDFVPDFVIAALGRSGSTMIANWLTRPPGEIVLIEPFLFALENPAMLHRQFADLGMAASPAEWSAYDADWQARFARLFAPRLAGRRWAVKEVLGEEHRRLIAAFAPPRVVITVRDIDAIAASFLEKHRRQGNRHRFDAGWVADYCRRETALVMALRGELEAQGTPHRVVRYEDFIASGAERAALAAFVGWTGEGDVGRHLAGLGRGFEAERHGEGVGNAAPSLAARGLDAEECALVQAISEDCAVYRAAFGYA